MNKGKNKRKKGRKNDTGRKGKNGGKTERPGERKILTSKNLQIQGSSKKLKPTAF